MAVLKHLFIVNPVAGRGIALKMVEVIENIFLDLKEKYKDLDYEIVYTKEIGHATDIAKAYSSKDDYRIYAVGGDGTLNEVLNGMIGSGSSLGCIPGGSGNDFIKSEVDKFDRKRILLDTILGSEEEIDVGLINGRYFLNIASIGFDASVVVNSEKFKNIKAVPSKFAYILSVLYTSKNFEHIKAEITIDDIKIDTKIFLVAVANGRFYGGGIEIAPEADFRDGLFDVVFAENMTFKKIMKFFPAALRGKHLGFKEVSLLRGKKVKIVTEEPVFLNVDGEINTLKEANFEISDKKVKMIIPRNNK